MNNYSNGRSYAALAGRCFANLELLRLTLKRTVQHIDDEYLLGQIKDDLKRTHFVLAGFSAVQKAEESRFNADYEQNRPLTNGSVKNTTTGEVTPAPDYVHVSDMPGDLGSNR